MPQQELSHRFQDAVYWPYAGVDEYGEPTRDAAVQLKVRWVPTRRQVLDPQGNPVVTDAMAVVDRVIAPQSLLWLGKLQDWVDSGSQVVMEVISQKTTLDVKGRATAYECNLGLFKGRLPPAAS